MLVIRYFVFIALFVLGSLSSSHAFDLKKLEGELGNALKELEQNLNKVAPKDVQSETVKKPSEIKTKKVESVTASDLKKSERDDLNAELKFLTKNRNNFSKSHVNLSHIPSEYLNFKNKRISLTGIKDVFFKGKNCGKSQIDFTLKTDGTGVKKVTIEGCDFLREFSGVWVSKQDKVAFAYMRNTREGMGIFVETLTIDFERAQVFNYLNLNIDGERRDQSYDGGDLTTYLDLDSGQALPTGAQLQQINHDRSIQENTKSKTALFGIKVLDNPSNYKIKNKRRSKEVRPIAGNTLTELLEAKYGAKLEFNFYDVVPPIKNKSFYDYKIRTVSVNGIEVVSNINARAKCPLKGLEGCQNFSDAIAKALYKKYGFVVDKDIEILDEKRNVLIVKLKQLFTVDEEFPVGGQDFLSVDGLWMSLGIKWSEESLLAKFGIDPSSKKSVDTNF